MPDIKDKIVERIQDIIVEVLLRLGGKFLSPLENALRIYDQLYEALLGQYLDQLTPQQLEQLREGVFAELENAIEADRKKDLETRHFMNT